MKSIVFIVMLICFLTPMAQGQTLGIGWAGSGAGVRYWAPETSWGGQAGGLFFSNSDSWGDGGISEGGAQKSIIIHWGGGVLYRLNEPEKAPNLLLSFNINRSEEEETIISCTTAPTLATPCRTESRLETSFSIMTLGGLEWIFFDRFSLALEVGFRYEQRSGNEDRQSTVSLGPGFSLAFLFYLF